MPHDELRHWLTRELLDRALAKTPLDPETIKWMQIGHDRGFTGQVFRVAWADGVAIVKCPDTTTSFERCAREVRFLDRFGASLPLSLPGLLGSRIEESRGVVWLLLEMIEGHEHDALAGCDANTAKEVLDAIAPLHAMFWNDAGLDELDWLPHWGQGQAQSHRPHRRRSERFRKRAPACVDRIGSQLTASMKQAIECLHDDFESMLAEMAALPFTMIHADLHLDNLVWQPREEGERLVFLDWQSVSKGPVLYEVVSFLVESLHGQDNLDQLVPLYEHHLKRLGEAGVDPASLAPDDDQLQRMILVVLAGFLSAYGNPDFHTRPQRLQDLFYDLFTDERLGGIIQRLTIL